MTTTKHILIICLGFILSCTQTPKQVSNEINKAYLDKKGVFYYWHESNCFGFNERCDLDIVKLVNYDTLIYVSSSEQFGRYEEYHGRLQQINDSIYYVNCFKSIRQEGVKPYKFPTIDKIAIICDSSLIGKNINLIYENKTIERFKVYSIRNEFAIKKNLFNSEKNKIKINLDYPHPIADENVQLIGQHNSDICFLADKENFYGFYVVIDSLMIKSINYHSDISWGPSFHLKRHSVETKLSMGRKLRR